MTPSTTPRTMRSRISRHRVLTIGLAVVALTAFSATPAFANDDHGSKSSEPMVVAQGLHNPRQLSFGDSGALYVAEAGSGGSGPCMKGPEGGTICFGTTGSVTKVSKHGGQHRVIHGLPSLANEDGSEALGASDVMALSGGKIAVLIGLGANPDVRDSLPKAGAKLGTLRVFNTKTHKSREIADLAAYEAKANPIDNVDSDPVGLAVGKGRFIVADAGGNDVLSVTRGGKISTVAAFPDRMVDAPDSPDFEPGQQIPMQAVPTSAVHGPDGAWYVSELTGFPFPVGAANIYRIGKDGEVSVWASGLTNVTDLAFHGSTLYAVEIASAGLLNGPTGALVRVDKGSTSPTVVMGDLFAPYGLAFWGDAVYVTTGSVSPDKGEVMRIPLHH